MPCYSHLSCWEREQIAALRAVGSSFGSIARAIGRAVSTVSRELKRNRLDGGGYSARAADGAYIERRQRRAVLEEDTKLRLFVVQRLSEGWSPEQIAGWLRTGSEPGLGRVCTETIYSFIYRNAQRADELWRYLARRRKRRRPLRARPPRETIRNRTSIHQRPGAVDERSHVGHWEGDLIICKCTRPVLVVHERKSRLTLVARLTGKTAAETASTLMALFARLEPALRQSLTFDNDTASARHDLIADRLGMKTWFCDAYASWQKGGVENANGRLRRWLPRQLDIDQMSDQGLQDIVMTYNLTPRKCLGYITPLQALFKDLGKDIKLRFA